MTTGWKWFLWADATVLVLLIVFVSNLALVLPVQPRVEFWGLAWPPFTGNDYIRIPDGAGYVSFCALVATAGVLLAYGLAAAVGWIKTTVVHRKLKARG